MLSMLAVVVFLVLLAWLLRASRRWTSSSNDAGWDAGYHSPLGTDGAGCSADADRDALCDSDSYSDADSGGDCGGDSGSSD